MTGKSKDEGSIAKASGGQPELDVDALMESVNAHNESSAPAESDTPAEAPAEPAAEPRKSKSNNT